MAAIPSEYHDLFERSTIAHIATKLPNGFPHVTPVWIDYDVEEELLLVNTERDRRKERNVREDPKVGVSMTDPDNPYRRVSVYGEVVEHTTEDAREHIDELSERYTGQEYTESNEIVTERVLLKISPNHVF
ncbi:PPOX class F420-dependent oxidoreductase [Natronoarchaeum sp. GCM10025703]|uniref:PPOX class F420-dependent oxidoreductase n=1 Tax=unclassified Natronoarchaeum TaxID=2620183 RepID=UPI003622FC5A